MTKSIVRAALSVVLVCMLTLALAGCEFGTFSTEKLDNPKLAITEFVEDMRAGKFTEAMERVGNYSTMGFDTLSEYITGQTDYSLASMLMQSYAVEFYNNDMDQVGVPYESEDMNIDGKTAYVSFKFTSLSFPLMSETLKQLVTEEGSNRMYYGETFDSEEEAMALVDEVFEKTFDGDISSYCTTVELKIELIYADDGWKLVIDDEFYKALLGK